MPGIWARVVSICGSRRSVAFRSCREWADQGSASCTQWADQGSNQCSQWADEGHSDCDSWADEGHNECCDWWPCSWFCDAIYWVAKWVCHAWYWVANWVCKAWYWVAKWVCLAWFWIAKWVCLAWTFVFYLFCDGEGGALFQLTDGTVLLNENSSGHGTRRWWKLTPDAFGSYASGVWTRVADSTNSRKYFASAVMADGRVIVCGGEYSDVSGSNSKDWTAASEIYDPVANAWTALAPPAGIVQIGDSPCSLLPDGRFLLGSSIDNSCNLFDPVTSTWANASNKDTSGSEESWVLMPEGTVLTVQCSSTPNAEKYVIANDSWFSAGALPSNIVEPSSLEIGPAVLLADGRAFFVGSNSGRTALYTQGANATAAGTWAAGPMIPNTSGNQARGSKDGPGVVLPSGTVLFPAAPLDGQRDSFLSPCSFFEFDGTNLAATTDAPNSDCATYFGRLLILPTGEAMWVREDDASFYVYTESAVPLAAAQPVITSVPLSLIPGTTVQITGRGFNGLTQAVGYGDDYMAATNYPLVRIRHTASGHVRYCRTANHTLINGAGVTVTSMGVATGAALITTHVELPADLELGPSELFVVANGVASAAAKVVVRSRKG